MRHVLLAGACAALTLPAALGLPGAAEETAEPSGPPACEHHLLSLDAAGAETAGSKEALIAYLRTGSAVRIGFRLAEDTSGGWYLTHWIEPYDMDLMGGNIFTRAPRVHRNMPDGDLAEADLTGETDLIVSLIGTDGTLVARHEAEKMPRAREMDSWWCGVGE